MHNQVYSNVRVTFIKSTDYFVNEILAKAISNVFVKTQSWSLILLKEFAHNQKMINNSIANYILRLGRKSDSFYNLNMKYAF